MGFCGGVMVGGVSGCFLLSRLWFFTVGLWFFSSFCIFAVGVWFFTVQGQDVGMRDGPGGGFTWGGTKKSSMQSSTPCNRRLKFSMRETRKSRTIPSCLIRRQP